MEAYLSAAQIIVTRTQDENQTRVIDFPSEIHAQNRFDEIMDLAKGASEFGGYLRWDLVVHHRELGKLVRRTMYTAE